MVSSVRAFKSCTHAANEHPKLTIVNVIEMSVGIVGIVDHERPAKTVTILRGEVAVIPECAYTHRPALVPPF